MKPGFAAGDQIKDAAACYRAEDLSDDVRQNVVRRKSFARPESKRDRRVKMAARNMADSIGHRQHRQTKRERDAGKTNAEARESRGQTRHSRIRPEPAKAFQ